MQIARVSPWANIVKVLADAWKNWRERRARLVEFASFDSDEMQRIARDLGTSISELRVLVGRDRNAAELLQRRLHSINLDLAAIEPAVMRDLQRCCSNCDSKTLCEHELEDKPKVASWPKYCPNEQTIGALISENHH